MGNGAGDRYGDGTVGTADGKDDALNAQLHTFDLAGELTHVRSTEGWRQGQHSARTPLKVADLRLVLIAMHAGDRIEAHLAPGPISIHTLSGRIRVTAAGQDTSCATRAPARSRGRCWTPRAPRS